MSSEPRFSLIVPAYNESELLPRLLETALAARSRYRGGPVQIEIVVADNDSTDDTAEIAKRAGCRVEHVTKRCIAAARNGGARAARGRIFCFVDADCIVHPETFNVIDDGLEDRVVLGTTGVIPEYWTLGLRVTYGVMFSALWLYQMDAGVVFCRREDFEEVDGYNEDLLFAEDVDLMWKLRRLGRSRRPKRVLRRFQGARTLASNRKFEKHGQWHMLTTITRQALLSMIRPGSADAFARSYWYDDRT